MRVENKDKYSFVIKKIKKYEYIFNIDKHF